VRLKENTKQIANEPFVNMTISNIELSAEAERRGIDLPLHHILLSDELLTLRLMPTMNIVINSVSSGSRSEGKHWTMLMVRGKYASHFDSYAGVPCTSIFIFCKKHSLTLCHNKFICQSMRSTECGLFCLALLVYEKRWERARVSNAAWGNPLYEMVNDYINLYDANANKNDAILAKYLNNN
jgi:hypothetical protein